MWHISLVPMGTLQIFNDQKGFRAPIAPVIVGILIRLKFYALCRGRMLEKLRGPNSRFSASWAVVGPGDLEQRSVSNGPWGMSIFYLCDHTKTTPMSWLCNPHKSSWKETESFSVFILIEPIILEVSIHLHGSHSVGLLKKLQTWDDENPDDRPSQCRQG